MADENAPTPDFNQQLASLPDLRGEPSGQPSEADGLEPSIEQPRRRRRWRTLLATLLGFAVVVLVALTVYAKVQFDRIERVDVAGVLSPPSPGGTNYLIVGNDSRENLDPDIENAGAIFGDGTIDVVGQRTDTIQILRVSADGTKHVLALPRDLYLPLGGNGTRDRINAAFAFGGAELLITTIRGSLGIPIHHYAEVDFAGFIDLVDAVGGVTIEFENPAYDVKSGLNVPEAGAVTLNSAQALAFVRSRNYTETVNGQSVVDPRGDLGRVKRQQVFLQSLFDELGDPWSVIRATPHLGASAGSMRLDNSWTFVEVLRLAQDLRGLQLNSDWDLAVSNVTVANGAQVLALDVAASQPTLNFFSG